MLIPLQDVIKKYGLNIKCVIQVGAHWAEEHEVFMQLGIKNIVYIEPCEQAFNAMIKKVFGGFDYEENGNVFLLKGMMIGDDGKVCFSVNKNGITMFQCACGDEEDYMDMHVSHNNQGQSNSLLKPALHLQQHPEVVFTDTERVKVMPLDKLPFNKKDYNLLMMDVQGAEGLVLKGATGTLKYIDCIYTECNRGQTYSGNMEIDEMDEYLKPFGFVRVETYWPSPSWSWGDAIFIKQ